ncbi:hypothetical protein N0V93_000950 [Gnomoniopsis smithogilvyi]|uniref:Calcium channel YVC1-like C-terminal transmembrane domain-containing protein n=1 Tax=Gnomoniopsis smithogilvyi TaxID=1191159 RepID=A0A9W8Z167_9PEZI|nr:hypothetical protein N0V93_000950 [Gnomoniopsis smithogilvyi]
MASDPQRISVTVPVIGESESFADVSKKLASYIIPAVSHPLGWEDLRSSTHLVALQPLIDYLARDCHNVAVVAALVALKGHFTAIESDDDCGINESRGFACELVAWQFVLQLSEQDALEYLLFELREDCDDDDDAAADDDDEETGLLVHHRNGNGNGHSNGNSLNGNHQQRKSSKGEGFAEPFLNLNTLEIAAVSGAKKFLSQRAIQDIVTDIWNGEIVFWNSLAVNATKKPRFHNKNKVKGGGGDPWCRLRVPRYMKTFEILFFVCFLALFYVVSLQRVMYSITVWEGLFYVFVLGFAFDELDDFVESGAYFYSTDIWALWDIGIVLIGTIFFVLRMVGLATGHAQTLNWAFSVLALHSLLLTPRIFSLISLSPYYGSLLPCLKEMGKQFIRFLGFTLIIYLGFFSTFILLARGHFPLDTLSITILKVFFGAGVVGFDIASQVSPYLGLPVMIVFVCLTNQLLITSMMAHISNSLSQMLSSSREEYLYVYSVYVLEAVTSDKLTYFQPPLNLIPVILFKPLLLLLPHAPAQELRILLLKATHAPFIGIIWLYERWEAFELKRDTAALSLNIFGVNTGTLSRSQQSDKTNVAVSRTNKKHTLKKSGKVRVPSALLSTASKRPSKQVGVSQDTTVRANTAPAAMPAREAAVKSAETVTVPIVQNIEVAEMMRMLKTLTAQVEEVRSALVKHDQGSLE